MARPKTTMAFDREIEKELEHLMSSDEENELLGIGRGSRFGDPNRLPKNLRNFSLELPYTLPTPQSFLDQTDKNSIQKEIDPFTYIKSAGTYSKSCENTSSVSLRVSPPENCHENNSNTLQTEAATGYSTRIFRSKYPVRDQTKGLFLLTYDALIGREPNDYVIKEITIYNVLTGAINSFGFKKPFDKNRCYEGGIVSNHFLTKQKHGLTWEDGWIPYVHIRNILDKYIPWDAQVFVKGLRNVQTISKHLSRSSPRLFDMEPLLENLPESLSYYAYAS